MWPCSLAFMMNDVENEVEEQQAEDGLVNRVPELKQLSEDIDKATNTFINAALELENLPFSSISVQKPN